MSYSIIQTTCKDNTEAKMIATALLETNLAACIQLQNIESVYLWEGTVCENQEVLLSIKTLSSTFSEISECIQELHSYDVAEIIEVEIKRGSKAYLSWIEQVVT